MGKWNLECIQLKSTLKMPKIECILPNETIHFAVNSHRVEVRIHRILSNNVKVIELIWGCLTSQYEF